MYLGSNDLSSADEISRRADAPLQDVLNMPLGKEYFFERGRYPVLTKSYDVFADATYKKMLKVAWRPQGRQVLQRINIIHALKKGNASMVNEAEFFEAVRNSEYACLPNALYSLFILAVNNQDKEELIVRKYTRPTTVEDAVYLYKLNGL